MMMLHSLRILKALLRRSISNAIEYRVDVIGALFVQWIYVAANLLTLYVVVLQTSSIGGWSAGELVLFYLMGLLVLNVLEIFVTGNLRELPESIRTGNFDFLLVQPAPSLFLLSFRDIAFRGMLEFLTLIGLIIGTILWLDIAVTVTSVLTAIAFLVVSAITAWAFMLFLMTWSFWLVQIDNAAFLGTQSLSLGRVPVSFYGRFMGFVLRSFVPAAIVGNLPVQILVGRVSSGLIGWSLVVAVLYTVFSIAFYRFAVRRYSSASS